VLLELVLVGSALVEDFVPVDDDAFNVAAKDTLVEDDLDDVVVVIGKYAADLEKRVKRSLPPHFCLEFPVQSMLHCLDDDASWTGSCNVAPQSVIMSKLGFDSYPVYK